MVTISWVNVNVDIAQRQNAAAVCATCHRIYQRCVHSGIMTPQLQCTGPCPPICLSGGEVCGGCSWPTDSAPSEHFLLPMYDIALHLRCAPTWAGWQQCCGINALCSCPVFLPVYLPFQPCNTCRWQCQGAQRNQARLIHSRTKLERQVAPVRHVIPFIWNCWRPL